MNDGQAATPSASVRERARQDGAHRRRSAVAAQHAVLEFDAELAEMGLSAKASWYMSAALYGGGGVLVTVTDAIQPHGFPHGVLYLSSTAIAMSVLSLFAARRCERWARAERWATHARMLIGVVIWAVGMIILGKQAIVFTLLALLTTLTPCYVYPPRLASCYAVAATAVVVIAVLAGAEPDRPAHALVSALVLVGVSASLIITRSRTLALARRNRRLAYTDPLTGIANMRALRERIADDNAPHEATRSSCALFVMDLDNFKQVNDTFDHSVGDRVLCAVARGISAELESGDLAIRRGGDEFAVLARCAGQRDPAELAPRLRDAIVRARVDVCPEVTPSGGVAWVRMQAGEELARMMERADDALHHVKAAARAQRLADERSAPGSQPVQRCLAHKADRMSEPIAPGGRLAGGRLAGWLAQGAHVWRSWLPSNVDADWGFTALVLAPTAAVIAVVSLAGIAAPLSVRTGGAVAGGTAALCALSFIAAIRRTHRRWLHAVWLALLALLIVAIASAGGAGTALLDLLPGVAILVVLVVGTRAALAYTVAALVPYGAFAITAGYPYADARTVASVAVTVIVAVVVARLRIVTVRFARRNRELSEVDALTGLANQRALHDRVVDVVERASAKRARPLVVSIDLDQFKQVNDSYSHSVGDRVLVGVARAVSQCVRMEELVARRGGDEFAVVLADTGSRDPEAILSRIGTAIERARLRICPGVLPTASIAAVTWEPGEAPGHLLERADVALHDAKHGTHERLASATLVASALASRRLAAAG